MKRGRRVTAGEALRAGGLLERAEEATAEAERAAFEERAAIIQEGAKVSRSTSERWARECLRRVPGAV